MHYHTNGPSEPLTSHKSSVLMEALVPDVAQSFLLYFVSKYKDSSLVTVVQIYCFCIFHKRCLWYTGAIQQPSRNQGTLGSSFCGTENVGTIGEGEKRGNIGCA